ncbi:MAG: VOC family protein [Nitrospinota bacterium]
MQIAFISYPVTDLTRAVEFYQKVLEIEPLFQREDWVEFKLENQRFALQKAPVTEPSGAVLYLLAQPLERQVERLERLGAKLVNTSEIYSYGKLARFEDPDGNIFGLYEPPMNTKH